MYFWNRLRTELINQDLTHKEFADKIGIIKGSLESKFARENIPDADFLYQCSKALGLSMDYLYTGVEKENEISHEDFSLLHDYHLLTQPNKDLLRAIIISMIQLNNK